MKTTKGRIGSEVDHQLQAEARAILSGEEAASDANPEAELSQRVCDIGRKLLEAELARHEEDDGPPPPPFALVPRRSGAKQTGVGEASAVWTHG